MAPEQASEGKPGAMATGKHRSVCMYGLEGGPGSTARKELTYFQETGVQDEQRLEARRSWNLYTSLKTQAGGPSVS